MAAKLLNDRIDHVGVPWKVVDTDGYNPTISATRTSVPD